METLQLSMNVSPITVFKSGTTNRKREYTRKGGGKGWFTFTLIIEFCKLNHQSTATEAEFIEKQWEPYSFPWMFPQLFKSGTTNKKR
jgi:hypothetical protein